MIKKLLLLFVAVVAIFLVYIALQPANFIVTRTVAMNASLNAVFEQVNDFHKWENWSPWAKLDPNGVTSFEGPDSGVGATFRWSGNSDVGEGSMTIIESTPPDQIKIRLDFLKPFQATNTALFTIRAPTAESTNALTIVTWSMYGKSPFLARVFCFFMDMDKTVGGQFEKGLANMKAIVEGKAP